MAAFQKGTVRAENALANIKHIWELNFTAAQGGLPYTVNEEVTWNGATGTGTFVDNDTGNKVLKLYRTAGVEPVIGDTILGSTSGATTVVSTLAASSPPDYDNVTTGLSSGDRFNLSESGVIYVVTTNINNDNFDLSVTFAEATVNDAQYQVVVDFTSFFSWPTPALGDVDSVSIVKDAITQIDGRLKSRGYLQQSITSSGGTASVDWTLGHAAAITLSEVTTMSFTAPEGPGEVIFKVTQDPSTQRDIVWPATAKWSLGSKPALGLVPLSSVNIIKFYFDGTNYHGTFVTDSK